MRRVICKLSLVLTALVAVGLARPGLAQQNPPTNTMPFKWTVSGKADVFLVPTDPPILSSRMTLKGSSDVLGGEVTFIDTHIGHLGIDGSLNRSNNGIGVFAGPSGDAVFVNWDGAGRPGSTPGVVQGVASFTIRGGRGKFAGAIGSGVFNSIVNLSTLEVTQVWEGVIAVPKQ
jgi:hypothetical protein